MPAVGVSVRGGVRTPSTPLLVVLTALAPVATDGGRDEEAPRGLIAVGLVMAAVTSTAPPRPCRSDADSTDGDWATAVGYGERREGRTSCDVAGETGAATLPMAAEDGETGKARCW